MNNLIGVVGRINVGKDLLYHIINYIVDNNFENINLEGFKRWQQSSSPLDTPYENKKFADKLKDIVCLLIGCTRDQLEDEVFKSKELGEEWWYFFVSGRIHSPYIGNEGLLQLPVSFMLIKLTPRRILQLLGTECGRQIIHPQIWINSLFSEYEKGSLCNCTVYEESDNGCFHCDYSKYDVDFSKWIITDCRFPNEVKAIEDRGGIVINLIRPGIKQDNHESETALNNHVFEHTIINDGTIEDLIEKTLTLLKTIK